MTSPGGVIPPPRLAARGFTVEVFYGNPTAGAPPPSLPALEACAYHRAAVAKNEPLELVVARAPADYISARALFEEYASHLGVDLCFQNFGAELERLPAMYGAPLGRLILARRATRARAGVDASQCFIGCVGVRPLANDARACEMKRLYVRPAARSAGVGRALAVAAMVAGRELGYERMVLDTLGRMTEARRLYAGLGFVEVESYYPNPNDDVKYMEVRL